MTETTRAKPNIREKTLAYGLAYPIDEELVMMILGSGAKDFPVDKMARKIVETLNATNDDDIVEALLKVKGIGQGKALAVAAALELGRRRCSYFGKKIVAPKDLVPYIQHYGMCSKEHFLLVTLDGGYRIHKIHVISVGTINRTLIHPREVFREAIRENAASVIFCHNHPSGGLSPSKEDIDTTKNLLDAAFILGIKVLDHIIINCENYFSFLENEVLFQNSQSSKIE